MIQVIDKNGNVKTPTSATGAVWGSITGTITDQTDLVAYIGSQGFITASSTNTLTNKSGLISQWTNDSGYLTSLSGAVTSVSGTANQIGSTGGATPVISLISGGTLPGAWALGTPASLTLTNATGLPNSGLLNSSITIGSTALSLGATSTTLAGLSSVTSTTFVGALTGNATTATALATGRTISISGDLTYTSPSFDGSGNVTAVGTLATVNSNVGSFGSATQVGTFTVNGKGLITAAADVTITPAVGSITGLGTGVATALAVNVGSAGAFVTFNGAGGTPSSLTLTNATGLPLTTGVTGILPDGNYQYIKGIIGASWAGTNTLAATTTQFLSPMGAFTNFNGTEGVRQWVCPVSGTIRTLYVTTGSSQSGTGTFVFTVRKNGSNTAVVATVTAGGAAGNYTDLSNSVSVTAGDLISIQGANNASTTSAIVLSISFLITNY